jgi:predicted esterase
MSPEAHHIKTVKTARYFTIGQLNEHTKEVWFVLHGYAQLASDFIKDFDVLDNGCRFIIAPEGLNRFYAKGFGGRPAATWMTSEDRQHEISDYLCFLETLYSSFDIKPQTRVVILGFSQGVTTASRFIHHTNHRITEFVIYSGEIGAELASPLSEKIKALSVVYITGNKDPFITPEKHERVYALMRDTNARIIEFDGGHEVKREVLQQIVK